MQRSIRIVSAVLAVFMVLTVAGTVPSFAAGGSGYVTVSFEDRGIRREQELGTSSIEPGYEAPLGEIIAPTKIEIQPGDNVASVTLRLLQQSNIQYSASDPSAFYLKAIQNFNLNGKTYAEFGELSAGKGSGWMVSLNDWFINQGASAISVEDGDVIRWQYSCQLGSDISCSTSNQSAKIIGLELSAGSLSPAFDDALTEYALTLPTGASSVSVRALLENYWSKPKIVSAGLLYKPQQLIPVSDGTVISVLSEYRDNFDDVNPRLSDSLAITVKIGQPDPAVKKGDADGNGRITVRDITVLREVILGGTVPDAAQLAVIDMDGNGKVTVRDITAIREIILAG